MGLAMRIFSPRFTSSTMSMKVVKAAVGAFIMEKRSGLRTTFWLIAHCIKIVSPLSNLPARYPACGGVSSRLPRGYHMIQTTCGAHAPLVRARGALFIKFTQHTV